MPKRRRTVSSKRTTDLSRSRLGPLVAGTSRRLAQTRRRKPVVQVLAVATTGRAGRPTGSGRVESASCAGSSPETCHSRAPRQAHLTRPTDLFCPSQSLAMRCAGLGARGARSSSSSERCGVQTASTSGFLASPYRWCLVSRRGAVEAPGTQPLRPQCLPSDREEPDVWTMRPSEVCPRGT